MAASCGSSKAPGILTDRTLFPSTHPYSTTAQHARTRSYTAPSAHSSYCVHPHTPGTIFQTANSCRTDGDVPKLENCPTEQHYCFPVVYGVLVVLLAFFITTASHVVRRTRKHKVCKISDPLPVLQLVKLFQLSESCLMQSICRIKCDPQHLEQRTCLLQLV